MFTTGELVKVYRTRAKKEQAELAKILEITPLSFSNKERGITQFKVDELVKVAKELGVEVSELIGEDGENERTE